MSVFYDQNPTVKMTHSLEKLSLVHFYSFTSVVKHFVNGQKMVF